jgi:hypothetical protein
MLAGMSTLQRRRLARPRLSIWLLSLLAVGCATAKQAERPAPTASASRAVAVPAPRPADGLYAADEALRDALSGPWVYVGTGPWPGINRMSACAFRNERVLIVNVYCTITETQAFRIDVYSPQRGRVRIYAEANGPLSGHMRQQYFTFTAESEPPPGPTASVPQLSLNMSFQALSAYDEQRYNAFLPACYGGKELEKKRGGCLGKLAARANEWATRNGAFLERANDDWYRVVREMRALATRYGKEPDSSALGML